MQAERHSGGLDEDGRNGEEGEAKSRSKLYSKVNRQGRAFPSPRLTRAPRQEQVWAGLTP